MSMKKIFRTTLVWFLLIFLFRSYLRVFNKPLSKHIGSRFGGAQQVCMTGNTSPDLTNQISDIQNQLTIITQKIESDTQLQTTIPPQDSAFETKTSMKIALYYFNQTEDQKLAPEQQINIASILPVYRIFPASKNVLVDTINELLKWSLTSAESKQGFITEFPNAKFTLLSSDLASNGTLTLQFSEVPGFTDGWSARMLILSNLIKKTAMQFPGVKNVVFVPETLFQP